MATQAHIVSQPGAPPASVQAEIEDALAQSPLSIEGGSILSANPLVSRLPVEIDVAIPIREFRVRNLLALAKGEIIQARWKPGEDMPLAAPGTQLAWTEFEVVDQRLAVRITRLV